MQYLGFRFQKWNVTSKKILHLATFCKSHAYSITSKIKHRTLKPFFFWHFPGENGFNQAIELAAESLANVKFIQEKKLINSYFDQISQDTGKYCFGVDDTLRALEMGAVETLICWENLDIQRYSLKNHTTGELKVLHLTTEQEKDKTHFTGKFCQ